MKLLRKIISVAIAAAMVITVLPLTASDYAFAADSVQVAQDAYDEALRKEEAAKNAYEKANKEFKKGSYGFYQWIADTKTGWQKADAQEALQLLQTSSFRKYTKQGNPDDATDLDNMKSALGLFKTLAADRKKDEFYPGLQDPTIRSVYMARAQVNANASSYTMNHMKNDAGCSLANTAENLAWGHHYDPFVSWYDKEKKNYIAVRNYTLNKYHVDIATSDWIKYIYTEENFDYNAYIQETRRFGETGHYLNVVSGIRNHVYLYGNEPPVVYSRKANIVFFGLGFSTYRNEWDCCHSLEVDSDTYSEGYTVAEYTQLFNTYYKKVYPAKEYAAYNTAKANTQKALQNLQAAKRQKYPLCIKSLWASEHNVGSVLFKWSKINDVTLGSNDHWVLKFRTRKIGGNSSWTGWDYVYLDKDTMEERIYIYTDHVIEIHAQAQGDKTWSTGIITTPAGGKYQAMKTVHVINTANGKRLTETKVGNSAIYHTAISLKVGQTISVKPDYDYPVKDYKKRPRLYPNHMLYDIGNKSMITITKPNGSKYTGGIIEGTAKIKAVKAGKTTIIFRAPNGRTMIGDVTITN